MSMSHQQHVQDEHTIDANLGHVEGAHVGDVPVASPGLPRSRRGGGGGARFEERTPEAEQQQQRQQEEEPEGEGEEGNLLWQFLVNESWVDPKDPLNGLREDLFAGATLTMTQVPPAVAFSLMAHMPPLTGLISSFFIGVIVSIGGGRPGSISAAAGALAVVYPSLVDKHGPEALFLASIIGGVFFTLPGFFGVAKYVRLLPAPVMIGFVDGLAIAIARGQISAFRNPQGEYITGAVAGLTSLLVMICFACMFLLPMYVPKVTKYVPSTFIAIVAGTVFEHLFQMGTVTIGDMYDVSGAFPSFKPPVVKSEALGDVMVTAIVLAIIGLIESLLTCHIFNVLTETKGSFERESIAMGIANIVCGLSGSAFAGCAVVGPALLNFHSGGGRRRVSAFVVGIMMLVVVLGLYKVINWIPQGALSAVVFGIAVKTFDWRSLEMIFLMKVPIADALVIVVVTVVTVFTDLAIAVGCGVVISFISFSVDMYRNRSMEVDKIETETDPALGSERGTAVVFHLSGTLFFFSASDAFNKIEALHRDGKDLGAADVILDFGEGNCSLHDFSVLEALNESGSLFSRRGRRLHLRNLDASSAIIAERAAAFAPDVHNDEPGAFDGKVFAALPKETKREKQRREKEEADEKKGVEKKGGGDEEEIPPATAAELLAEVKLTVFVHSARLCINLPLRSFTYQELKAGRAVERGHAPNGFHLASHFASVAFSGRDEEVTEEVQGEMITMLKVAAGFKN